MRQHRTIRKGIKYREGIFNGHDIENIVERVAEDVERERHRNYSPTSNPFDRGRYQFPEIIVLRQEINHLREIRDTSRFNFSQMFTDIDLITKSNKKITNKKNKIKLLT